MRRDETASILEKMDAGLASLLLAVDAMEKANLLIENYLQEDGHWDFFLTSAMRHPR